MRERDVIQELFLPGPFEKMARGLTQREDEADEFDEAEACGRNPAQPGQAERRMVGIIDQHGAGWCKRIHAFLQLRMHG